MSEFWMREAIRGAAEGIRTGTGGPFGAVVVRGDKIIGRGRNEVVPRGDPTAHAEILAIREACRHLQTHRLEGCEIYASCEPCPMCLGAVYWARLDRVWFAASRSDAASIGFDDDLIYGELGIDRDRRQIPARQLLRDEAWEILEEWSRKADKTPY